MSSTSGTSFSPFENNGASSSNSSKAATDPSNQLQLFADERRSAISIPKIETDVGSNISSHSSSPYTSPRLAPRRKSAAGIGAMEEVTLPPIQAAVPMRRGAVSGASSGPLMPFPPIRPPYQDDEIPSRGPSPTLGKRGSFSMGHSNHVPPGPDIQLPTPVLSGSGERRGGLMSIPNYINTASSSSPSSSSLAHHPADLSDSLRSNGYTRPSEEGPYQYHPVPQRHGVPWSHHKSTIPRSESVEAVPPPLPTYQSSSPPMMHSSSSTGGSNHLRPAQFNDDRHYQSHARLPHLTPSHSRQYDPQHHASSGGYRYDYHRDESAMSPSSSNHGILHQDSSLSPRTKQEHYLHEENQHIHDLDSALNGKRPRSAPRVMSSQPRIFACTQCPARFARNHDLKRHQRGHLSVRPYPCNWCEKSFSRKDALKRHILVKGCGKESKNGGGGGGGGGGKGDGKQKRHRGEESDKRASHHAESSGGDQDDGQYGDDDEHDSEENQDGSDSKIGAMQHQWNTTQEAKDTMQDRLHLSYRKDESTAKYKPIKDEYREGRYPESMSQYRESSFGNPSLSVLTDFHTRRPSASVA